MTLVTLDGKLLVVDGKLAASTNCCCNNGLPGCGTLPPTYLAILAGLPEHGLIWNSTTTLMGPSTDAFGRYVCPPPTGFSVSRRFSVIDYRPANVAIEAPYGTAGVGWAWYADLTANLYEYVTSSPPGSGVAIVAAGTQQLRLSITTTDCVVGPGTMDLAASLIHIGGTWDYVTVGMWTKTLTLAAGETIYDKFPIVMDPEPIAWINGVPFGHTGADYGPLNCASLLATPIAAGATIVGYPGLVLTVP